MRLLCGEVDSRTKDISTRAFALCLVFSNILGWYLKMFLGLFMKEFFK